jgi:hypothetical protein
MKIVILNDLHPIEFPGAATIAHGFAKEASKSQLVEYWTSSADPSNLIKNEVISEKIFKASLDQINRVDNSFRSKVIAEFFSIRSTCWYIKNLFRFKPDIVWIHQIGSRFPRTVILINKFFRVRTLITLHDFSLVLPRKLFPYDLGLTNYEVDSYLINFMRNSSNSTPKLKLDEPIRFKIIYRLRIGVLRILYRLPDDVVAISSLQAKLLISFGFKISGEITNGVDKCSCPKQTRMKKAILFAGRPNAKGLEHVIQAVAASDWHLHLAGPSRLDEIAKQTLLHSQYTYHGALNSPELFELLHQVQAVAVLSECFDVFPTITIESLRHGTLVITTLNTGNSDLVRKISKDLLIHYSKIPKLVALDEVFQSFYKNNSDSDWSASLLTSVEDSYNSYLRNHLNPN